MHHPHQRYSCDLCNFKTPRRLNYIEHLSTTKHRRMLAVSELSSSSFTEPPLNSSTASFNSNSNSNSFVSNSSHTSSHFSSSHSSSSHSSSSSESTAIMQSAPQNTQVFQCPFCIKMYKSRTGLWLHKKKHHPKGENHETIAQSQPVWENTSRKRQLSNDSTASEPINSDLVKALIDQNASLIKMIQNNQNATSRPVAMSNTTNHNHQTINNTTNNMNIQTNYNTTNTAQFNLTLFLNETCKDAMNIDEFLKTLQVQLDEIEDVGTKGYITGMTNIIVRNLNALEVHKRPVHCTDAKRETLHVKADDIWESDSIRTRAHLHRAIKTISHHTILPKLEENQSCLLLDNKTSNAVQNSQIKRCKKNCANSNEMVYNQIINEVMSGTESNIAKVIKQLATQTSIHFRPDMSVINTMDITHQSDVFATLGSSN